MRVGISMWGRHTNTPGFQTIFSCTYRGVAAGSEVVFLPPEFGMVAAGERRRMAEEFLLGCDVVVGLLDDTILAARQRLGSSVPFVYFTQGNLAWGGRVVAAHMEHLTTRDVMVVNCTSEVEIARSLFRNATVRVVPFAYDEDTFHPLDAEERRAVRERLRFRESDRVILCPGLFSPERSVHSLLGIFDAVSKRVPDARLVLAGAAGQADLPPFGVAFPSFQNTLSRLVSRMEQPERVHVLRAGDDQRLRELYGAADVVVDLTLNPGEHFGMAQVESMACGTPVIGTAWGGLKDVIIDGVTGYGVSTVPTATGVKLNWWEAINQIVALLENPSALRGLRGGCIRAAGCFTQAAFGAILQQVVAETIGERGRSAEPLRPTSFAEELWAVCDPGRPGPAFRRGRRSEELHRALVTPFTAVSPAHVPGCEALEPDHVLSLATAVDTDGMGRLRLDDVFYAFEVEAPAAHQEAVLAILECMRERPALRVGELGGAVPFPGVPEALTWMLEAGLVLRSRPVPGWIEPAVVDRRLGEAAFTVREIDRAATDLIVYAA